MINGGTCCYQNPSHPRPMLLFPPVSPPIPHPGEPRAPESVSLSIRYTPGSCHFRSVCLSVYQPVPSPCCVDLPGHMRGLVPPGGFFHIVVDQSLLRRVRSILLGRKTRS